MHKLMDTGTGEVPQVNHLMRRLAASLLSLLLLTFALLLKLTSIVKYVQSIAEVDSVQQ